MPIKLKPCPFCGRLPETKQYGEKPPEPGRSGRGYYSFRIICRQCRTVEMEGWPLLDVVEKWNSRVS